MNDYTIVINSRWKNTFQITQQNKYWTVAVFTVESFLRCFIIQSIKITHEYQILSTNLSYLKSLVGAKNKIFDLKFDMVTFKTVQRR